MPRIKLYLSIGYPTAKHEDEHFIEDAVWDAMTPAEQEEELSQLAQDWGNNYIDLCAWVVEEGE